MERLSRMSTPAAVSDPRFEVDPEAWCGQRGVKSLVAFAAGEVLSPFSAAATHNRPSRMTLQVAEGEHIELAPPFLSLINHSCDPNVDFDVAQWRLVALRPIAVGEELTFFYPATEWAMASPFGCVCGSPRCLGWIAGAWQVPQAVLARYHLAPHIARLVEHTNGSAAARVGAPKVAALWWLGDALTVGPHGLELDGVAVAALAQQHGTPLYIYGAQTLRRRLGELRQALVSTGTPFRIHYAMKAARFAPLLAVLRGEGDVGIDACSPREVAWALTAGFRPAEISVTAGMPSNRDLAAFAAYGVHVNLDTRSALRRWAALRGPARGVGLRIDSGVQVGWGQEPKLSYGDSKFGFDADAVLEAATYAASLGLEVNELHIHAGWGLQASDAPLLVAVFARLAELARAIPTVRTINVGGGLCWRQRAQDEPLSPSTWAGLLRTHIAPTGCGIKCEPGTFIAASAGVLVAEVNTVETRQSGIWIGIDAGHNVNCYAAHYNIPLAIIKVGQPLEPPAPIVHIAGNINEANDIFARGVRLPRLDEGDLIAFYPAGAYGASMASDHCLRGLPAEVLV